MTQASTTTTPDLQQLIQESLEAPDDDVDVDDDMDNMDLDALLHSVDDNDDSETAPTATAASASVDAGLQRQMQQLLQQKESGLPSTDDLLDQIAKLEAQNAQLQQDNERLQRALDDKATTTKENDGTTTSATANEGENSKLQELEQLVLTLQERIMGLVEEKLQLKTALDSLEHQSKQEMILHSKKSSWFRPKVADKDTAATAVQEEETAGESETPSKETSPQDEGDPETTSDAATDAAGGNSTSESPTSTPTKVSSPEKPNLLAGWISGGSAALAKLRSPQPASAQSPDANKTNNEEPSGSSLMVDEGDESGSETTGTNGEATTETAKDAKKEGGGFNLMGLFPKSNNQKEKKDDTKAKDGHDKDTHQESEEASQNPVFMSVSPTRTVTTANGKTKSTKPKVVLPEDTDLFDTIDFGESEEPKKPASGALFAPLAKSLADVATRVTTATATATATTTTEDTDASS